MYNYNKHGHKANECKEKPKFEGKCHKCKRHGHKASECRSNPFNPVEQPVKAMFGWDYNTWCRCHYCGEYRHTSVKCVRNHLRKMDSTVRCYTCTEIGHIAKNCINIGKIDDERKAKTHNIRKKMRQQLIPKTTEETSSNHERNVTQEMGGSIL